MRTFHQGKRDVAGEELLDELKLDDGSQHPFGRGQRSPGEIVEAVEATRQLQAALDRLPDEDERQIVVWRVTDELPFTEIARQLRCSNDAIESAFPRSVQRLKQWLSRTAGAS